MPFVISSMLCSRSYLLHASCCIRYYHTSYSSHATSPVLGVIVLSIHVRFSGGYYTVCWRGSDRVGEMWRRWSFRSIFCLAPPCSTAKLGLVCLNEVAMYLISVCLFLFLHNWSLPPEGWAHFDVVLFSRYPLTNLGRSTVFHQVRTESMTISHVIGKNCSVGHRSCRSGKRNLDPFSCHIFRSEPPGHLILHFMDLTHHIIFRLW